MQACGLGTPVAGFGPLVERLMLNQTDPDHALGDRRSTTDTPHPFLRDPAVYKAL